MYFGVGRVGSVGGKQNTTFAASNPSLSLDFMTPGSLDPRITFTRASTATYFDAGGVMQTATTNTPRWDHDPNTLQLRGLLIEEARTNLWLQSADASNAVWSKSAIGAGAAPTVTANQVAAPDGTNTAARVVYPAISASPNGSVLAQQRTVTAAVHTFSVYLRGNVGGEQLYLFTTLDTSSFNRVRVTLTTSWQRFTLTTSTLTAAGWYFEIGADLRDTSQTSIAAQTIYVWGAQLEAGAFTTSYIPTTSAVVTRANDVCSMPTAAWFNASTGTLASEIIYSGQPTDSYANVSSLTGTDGNTDHITLLIAQTAARAGGGIKTGGVALWGSAHNTPVTTGTVMRLSVAYRPASAASFAYSGIMGTMSGPGGTLPTITALRFMPYGVNYQLQLTGYMRSVQYWNRALSDAEMQSVTA